MKYHGILVVFIALSMLCTCANTGDAQQTFAKLGTTLPAEHPALQALAQFQNTLSEELTIQLFPDAQLGSAQQLIEGLQFGDIEMGLLPIESLGLRAPFLSMFGMPYFFRDDIHRKQVLDGPLGRQFLESLDELNLVGLGFLETYAGFYLTKDQPLNSLESFQGQKIAVICLLPEQLCRNQTDAPSLQSLKIMGANPIIIPLGSLEDSLASETPDIIEYQPFTGMERQFQGHGFNTLILPAHRAIPTILVAGKRWFDAQPPHARLAVAGAANTLVRRQRTVMNEAFQQEPAALQARGFDVNEGDQEDLRQAVQALYAETGEQFGPEFAQFFNAVQAIH